MAISEKEQCVREILSYATQIRTLTTNYTSSKKTMGLRGFKSDGTNPITDEDLLNLNITAERFYNLVNAMDALGSAINGAPIEAYNIIEVIEDFKWWSK
jgi:hypothetical protein